MMNAHEGVAIASETLRAKGTMQEAVAMVVLAAAESGCNLDAVREIVRRVEWYYGGSQGRDAYWLSR